MSTSNKHEVGDVHDEYPKSPVHKRARTRMQSRLAAMDADSNNDSSTICNTVQRAIGNIEMATLSSGTAICFHGHAVATHSVDARSPTPVDEKPMAIRTPPVWSFTRGALSDATEYLRTHEGGNYHKDGITIGLLIDATTTPRDYIDGTVIITNVGGGRVLDDKTNQMHFGNSQDESSNFWKYLTKAREMRRAVVVVIGDRNPRCPVKPPRPYCVMAHFQITDIWSEVTINPQDKRIAFWMIRLEKILSSTTSWWADEAIDQSHIYSVGEYTCKVQQCERCHKKSKHIYNEGWTCLNYKCPMHFNFDLAGCEPHQVSYNQSFLRERSDSGPIQPLIPLITPLPSSTCLTTSDNFGYETDFKRGIVCPQCHCCSRRIHWAHWQCENPDCDFVYKAVFRDYPVAEIFKENMNKRKGRRAAFEVDDRWVQGWTTSIAGYSVETYTLPDESNVVAGTVTVFRATPEICSKANGPNELFLSLQKKELKLKRNPARCKGARNEELCSHFSSNWGAHYKYGVFVETTGFAEAPEEILRVVSQLTWAQEQAIISTRQKFHEDGTEFSKESMSLMSDPFNELLSLGYFESSSISWHDDGEKELGPTVATLSLGAASVMRFRPKAKSTIGTKGNNKKGIKHHVLSLPLNHGDICIMHGTRIHKLYEHEVKPGGKLRFAMTCRSIRTDAIVDPKARQEAIDMGSIPRGIEHLAYRGINKYTPASTTDEMTDSVTLEGSELASLSNCVTDHIPVTSIPDSAGILMDDVLHAGAVAFGTLDTAMSNDTPGTTADAIVGYANSPGVDPLSAEDEFFSRILDFEQYVQANQDLVERLSLDQNAILIGSALRVATKANHVATARPNPEDI